MCNGVKGVSRGKSINLSSASGLQTKQGSAIPERRAEKTDFAEKVDLRAWLGGYGLNLAGQLGAVFHEKGGRTQV